MAFLEHVGMHFVNAAVTTLWAELKLFQRSSKSIINMIFHKKQFKSHNQS